MTTRQKAILSLIAANLIWGAAAPIFKFALQNIPPFTLAFIRFFAASCILFPFVCSSLWIEKKDWSKIFFLTIAGITVNITFFFMGLKFASSLNAPIIGSSGPLVLYLGSIFILHEKPSKHVLTGLLVGLIGVLVIIINPIIESGLNVSVLGNIFFLLAMLGAVGHALIGKDLLAKYSAATITFWSFFLGSLTFFPLFFFEHITSHPLASLDYRGVIGIIFGIFFSSLLAYLLFNWGLKKIDTQEVGIFTYIDPIAAACIALPLLHEQITLPLVLGSIMVFSGIFLAEKRIHYHPFHKLRQIEAKS